MMAKNNEFLTCNSSTKCTSWSVWVGLYLVMWSGLPMSSQCSNETAKGSYLTVADPQEFIFSGSCMAISILGGMCSLNY